MQERNNFPTFSKIKTIIPKNTCDFQSNTTAQGGISGNLPTMNLCLDRKQ